MLPGTENLLLKQILGILNWSWAAQRIWGSSANVLAGKLPFTKSLEVRSNRDGDRKENSKLL